MDDYLEAKKNFIKDAPLMRYTETKNQYYNHAYIKFLLQLADMGVLSREKLRKAYDIILKISRKTGNIGLPLVFLKEVSQKVTDPEDINLVVSKLYEIGSNAVIEDLIKMSLKSYELGLSEIGKNALIKAIDISEKEGDYRTFTLIMRAIPNLIRASDGGVLETLRNTRYYYIAYGIYSAINNLEIDKKLKDNALLDFMIGYLKALKRANKIKIQEINDVIDKISSPHKEILEIYLGKLEIANDDYFGIVRIARASDFLYKLGHRRLLISILNEIVDDLLTLGKVKEEIIELVAYFLEELGEFDGIYELFGKIAIVLVKMGKIDLALDYINEAGFYPSVPEYLRFKLLYEGFLLELMKAQKNKAIEIGLKLIEECERKGKKTLSTYIKVFLASLLLGEDNELAEKLISEVLYDDFAADMLSSLAPKLDFEIPIAEALYSSMINTLKAMVKEGKIERAYKLLKELEEKLELGKFALIEAEFGRELTSLGYEEGIKVVEDAIKKLEKAGAYYNALNNLAFIAAVKIKNRLCKKEHC